MRILRTRILPGLAIGLTTVGALNWGLVGSLRFNPVHRLLRGSPAVERAAYVMVGLAGAWVGTTRILPRALLALGLRTEGTADSPATDLLVGKAMPSVSGRTLSSRKVTIPWDTTGKVAFLSMGFSYDSRFDVEDWGRAFGETFGKDPDADFYEVAMIDWPFRLFGRAIDEGMRRGSPRENHDHVLTVYASQKPFRKALRAPSSSDTWVYLLDTGGQVLFQCGGAFDAERFRELTWAADAALARAKVPVQDIGDTL